MDELLYAGFLCATHVGKTLRINGVTGRCVHISVSEDKPTVRVVLHQRGTQREDGSRRKIVHQLSLNPRTCVEIVED